MTQTFLIIWGSRLKWIESRSTFKSKVALPSWFLRISVVVKTLLVNYLQIDKLHPSLAITLIKVHLKSNIALSKRRRTYFKSVQKSCTDLVWLGTQFQTQVGPALRPASLFCWRARNIIWDVPKSELVRNWLQFNSLLQCRYDVKLDCPTWSCLRPNLQTWNCHEN